MSRRVVVALLGPVTWTPPGIEPARWRTALAEDVVDLLATLNEVETAVAVAARDRWLADAVVWPGTPVYEVPEPTPNAVFAALAAAGYDQVAVVAADAPDVPGLTLGKLLRPLTTRPVAASEYFETGIYDDTLTSYTGCDSTVTTYLTVLDPIVSSTDYYICAGDSIVVGENVYLTSGTYTDVFTSYTGCDSVVTSNLAVTPEINTELVRDGLTLTAESGYTYQWITCEPYFIIDGATENSFTAVVNGYYAVILTSGDCTDTSDCYVINEVSLANYSQKNEIEIYPNPNNGTFTLELPFKQGTVIKIYEIMGNLIYEAVITSEKSTISLEDATPGLYLIEVRTENGTLTKKMTITP